MVHSLCHEFRIPYYLSYSIAETEVITRPISIGLLFCSTGLIARGKLPVAADEYIYGDKSLKLEHALHPTN